MEIEMLDAPEVREEPTAIQQTSIALVQGALTEFDKVEAGLADLRTKYANVVYAVNTAAGMAEAGDVVYITAAAIDPSDADIIFCAARAVSIEFGMTIDAAIARLADVAGWTVINAEGVTA